MPPNGAQSLTLGLDRPEQRAQPFFFSVLHSELIFLLICPHQNRFRCDPFFTTIFQSRYQLQKKKKAKGAMSAFNRQRDCSIRMVGGSGGRLWARCALKKKKKAGALMAQAAGGDQRSSKMMCQREGGAMSGDDRHGQGDRRKGCLLDMQSQPGMHPRRGESGASVATGTNSIQGGRLGVVVGASARFSYCCEGAWILRCRCKHRHIDHDCSKPPFVCKKSSCKGCTGFDSPWVCNCGHSWAEHTQSTKIVKMVVVDGREMPASLFVDMAGGIAPEINRVSRDREFGKRMY